MLNIWVTIQSIYNKKCVVVVVGGGQARRGHLWREQIYAYTSEELLERIEEGEEERWNRFNKNLQIILTIRSYIQMGSLWQTPSEIPESGIKMSACGGVGWHNESYFNNPEPRSLWRPNLLLP